MKGKTSILYAIGVLMILFGGAGLAEASLTDHVSFWVSTITFSMGIGFCLMGYSR